MVALKVLNKRRDQIPFDAVYVGRPSRWGNPFVIGRDGTREDVLRKYEEFLTSQPGLIRAIRRELRGKDLVCWCAPAACHADILLRIANEDREGESSMEDITSFTGGNRFLSNFYPVTVALDGVKFPSVENAYQASKYISAVWHRFTECDAAGAKRLSRGLSKVYLYPNWQGFKVDVMRYLLLQKFAEGSELSRRLMHTSPRRLIEGNTWNDTFWGVCNGAGENMLGELLMARREQLISEARIATGEGES